MASQVALPLKTLALLCSAPLSVPLMWEKKKKAGERSAVFPLLLNLLKKFSRIFTLCKETDAANIMHCSFLPVPVELYFYRTLSVKGQAHALITPAAQCITVNSLLLNFTCPDRTHLN